MSFHFSYVIAPRSRYSLRGVAFIAFPSTVTLSHIKATNADTSLTGAVPGETMTGTLQNREATVSSSHRCGIRRNCTQATERVLWEVGITSHTTSNCMPAVLSQVSQPKALVAIEGCEQTGDG